MEINQKIKVAVADFDKDFADGSCLYLRQSAKIDVVGCVHDGLEVASLIKNNDVDVLVMDLVLPTIDGIGVLDRIIRMQLNKRPHVLIVSSVLNETVTSYSNSYGVEDRMLKPVNYDALIDRITMMAR